jgi:type I restriction enzyme M protein
MAIKKSELYSTLWASCDKLRGGMDASQYKDYVLVLLFVKYVSDKYSASTEDLIKVPKGGSFNDLVALKHKKDIGEGINLIIGKLAEANGLTGIITQADFNDEEKLGKGKEMQDKLSDLITIFENPELDFSKNRADGDDILGDAYEYLMRHFAAESGKSKGQFYTPAEVSRIMAKILGINEANSNDETSAYDPTCGSGSLLLKVAEEAAKSILLYGQEKEVTTAGLAKMNMILHNNPRINIAKGQSTISNPLFLNDDGSLMRFDYAVSNPPFSSKNWTDGFNPYEDIYGRFKEFGVPPVKNGDYAFLLHILHSLKDHGKGAVVLPHGVLFRSHAEEDIRKSLIGKGYIKGIIGLPPNLFYGTSIPACIIVIDKENTAERNSIFMIDAGKGYVKDGNKNRLREQDIKKVVDVFTQRINVPKFSRDVPLSEIEANDYNLNIPRYIDSQEEEDLQDIEAHLLGDIPDEDINLLQSYWEVYPSLKNELFVPGKREHYSKLKVSSADIRRTIFGNSEFKTYTDDISRQFLKWQQENMLP